MVTRKHLIQLRKLVEAGSRKIDLAKSLLLSVALGEEVSPDFYNDRKVAKAFDGLRRYKFVRHTKEKNKTYSVTKKGQSTLQAIVIDEIKIKKIKNWDGKWRLVMYDLPIRFKKARDAFRWKLKDLGFLQFQKSAWIYPYHCEEEILFVANFYGVQKHIEILEVDKILNDKRLKAHFCLL